jgi:predicted transcriptional regulator of viral defense system
VIAALAARQHGVVSRCQLLDAGITDRMIGKRLASGQLVPLHRGVYAVGHAHLRPNGYRLAAVLAVGPGAVLSHRDAAALHGLRDGGGTRIDVSVPADRTSTERIRVHRRRRLDADDVTTVEGVPVTSMSRTLVDLGEVASYDALLKALREAERQRTLDVKGIEEALERLRGRRGTSVAKVRGALAELERHGASLTRSPLELDGWAWHNTRRAFQRDRDKANLWTGSGWTVLRFTHDDLVRRPEVVVAAVRAQLSRSARSARPPR